MRLANGIASAYRAARPARNFDSRSYWEQRYESGGRSGAGSYGRLAEYKAEFLNSFVSEQGISSVIEFGSGDGAQLGLFRFQRYIGLDVSRASIRLCMQEYADDTTKSFYLYDAEYARDNHHLFTAELALSLDVIYHLVEDHVYESYMRALFGAAEKFVVVYSSNIGKVEPSKARHVRHRRFTDWVEQNARDWTLSQRLINRYTLTTNELDESFADFYVYSRMGQLTALRK